MTGRRKILMPSGMIDVTPLPAEQPSNPVALTDDEIFYLWRIRDCPDAIATGDLLGQLIVFVRSIEARIVGQQTKGGGNA